MFPNNLGFHMPPEWAPHSRTLMAWPVKAALWPEPFKDILPSYAQIVNTIARFEPVGLVVEPELVAEAASYCQSNVELIPLANNDSWMRDCGPTFVRNTANEIAGINWRFNAWGGKFPYGLDDQISPALLEHYGVPCINVPLVMEGGSIHVDDEGTLLTTEECLLNPNRNPNLSRETIETHLKQSLNISKIIWLKRGWDGDDTDGHVDNVACFARPGVILTQICSVPTDPNYEITRENRKILKNATDAQGRHFEVIELEQPPARFYEGVRLTLSYLNFYFVNGGIVLPIFGEAASRTDANAINVLQRVFPERTIVPVDGSTIARGGGNVHCLTQQMPLGQPARSV